MAMLEWSEFACAERAQVGSIEFFVTDSRNGAELYTDGSSFDQSYGGTRYPSVAEAKAAAEQALREMHDALAAHFAPVLRWTRNGDVDTAIVAGLTLCATRSSWFVRTTKSGRLVDHGAIVSEGIEAARVCAARCASEVLGVPFRVEGE